MRTRDEIYLDILRFGLLYILAAATHGNAKACELEADHLHNIPGLIGEKNEQRHQYYFDIERTSYLNRYTGQQASIAEAKFALARYRELWAELEHYNMNKGKDLT